MAFHYKSTYIDFAANADDEIQSGSGITNEQLSDYEYGTWTLGLGNGTYGAGGLSLQSMPDSYYTKIGNVIYLTDRFGATHNNLTGGQTMLHRYLPFLPGTTAAGHGTITYHGGTQTAGGGFNGGLTGGGSPLSLSATPQSDSWQFTSQATAQGTSGTTQWQMGFTYYSDTG